MKFSTVVGHDQLKRALLLAAIDPHIGGVLLRGDKGSGKTTLARAFAGLMPAAPFVELPLGATEDRVLGSIDLGAALTDGTEQVRSGLLAAAHGGVLFVDEINLLADHLVDTLLDVAASGEHRLERDGISVQQPARFVLIGTMNPEEGELRPQLLDRFGFCVEVSAPVEAEERAEIVRRRLAVDRGNEAPDTDEELRHRLAQARSAPLEEAVILYASRLAVEVGVEGLRADLVLCRAAAALAGWEGRTSTTLEDVEEVAPLVLGHRRRRQPFDPPSLDPNELDEAIDRARAGPSDSSPPEPSSPPPAPPSSPPDGNERPGPLPDQPIVMGRERTVPRPVVAAAARAGSAGRTQPAPSVRGRVVRDRPHDPASGRAVGVLPTIRALATRRLVEPDAEFAVTDLRDVERVDQVGSLVIICLDSSGSMGAAERIEVATGTAMGVLADAYQRRDRVAVVAFGGAGARVVLSPTTSVEVARTRLASLTTGGATPLAQGLSEAFNLAQTSVRPGEAVSLVVITDGRATGGSMAFEEAVTVAGRIRAAGLVSLVIDTETGTPSLGLATQLAEALAAPVHRPG